MFVATPPMALVCPQCGKAINGMVYVVAIYVALVMTLSAYFTVEYGPEVGALVLPFLLVILFFIEINSGVPFCVNCYLPSVKEEIKSILASDDYYHKLLIGFDLEPEYLREAVELRDRLVNVSSSLESIRSAESKQDYTEAVRLCLKLGLPQAADSFLTLNGKRPRHAQSPRYSKGYYVDRAVDSEYDDYFDY